MSSAANRNFGLAQRHRERRINADLDNPGLRGVSADPAWDAFWGSLYEKGQQANADGLNFRADLSGLGQGGPSLALMRATRPGDQDTARTNAVNEYLGDLTTRRRMEDQSLRAMTADADLREAGTSMARGDVADRQAMDRAYAIANTPGVSQYGRPFAQTGPDRYKTAAPDPNAPPVDPREIIRQNTPGHLQPGLEKQYADIDKASQVTFGAPTAAMVNGKRVFVRAGSDGQMYGTDRRPIADAMSPASDAAEPLVAVIGPDNKPVLVPRSQAVGKTPASNREQGRPVTSGDAGRITELDTSLDDLKVLRETLGTTGAGSKIGAMLPNAVTEYTGWGADSKSRQGTIDRVKQVIGKALEGGVLRKEDEIKYEKILPTIGDPPSVAKSKLEGLEKALILRRQRTFDGLKDAGYETSQFEARHGVKPPPGGGLVEMIAPDGSILDVPADQVDALTKAGAKRKGGG